MEVWGKTIGIFKVQYFKKIWPYQNERFLFKQRHGGVADWKMLTTASVESLSRLYKKALYINKKPIFKRYTKSKDKRYTQVIHKTEMTDKYMKRGLLSLVIR